jgi:antitoxin MazE
MSAILLFMKTYLLTVQSRGTFVLPAAVRRRHHLDGPDAQIKLIEQDDGRLEIVPVVSVPADQAWFWTERWQKMEREAEADISAGRTSTVDGLDGMLGHLDSLRRR